MKILIITAVTFGLLFTGCSTTTYFNLKQTYPESVEKEIIKRKKKSDVGVEVTILLNSDNEVNGELLSVRDSTFLLCKEHSATEEELIKLQYPILIIPSNEIQQLTIVGSNWVAVGLLLGAIFGVSMGLDILGNEGFGGGSQEGKIESLLLLSVAAGGGIGYALSRKEYVLQEIPPDYNWSIMKSLARYPNIEPEYLGAIK